METNNTHFQQLELLEFLKPVIHLEKLCDNFEQIENALKKIDFDRNCTNFEKPVNLTSLIKFKRLSNFNAIYCFGQRFRLNNQIKVCPNHVFAVPLVKLSLF